MKFITALLAKAAPFSHYFAVFAVIGLVWSHSYMYAKGKEVGQADTALRVKAAQEAQAKKQGKALDNLRAQHAQEQAGYEAIIESLQQASAGTDWAKCIMPGPAFDILRDTYRRYSAE